MTMLLLFLGLLLILVGSLLLLIATFRVSIWWGIASLLIPVVQIIFVFKYWSESKSAIFAQTMGLLLILAAALVGGKTFTNQYKQQLNSYMQKVAPEQMQQLNELQSMVSEPTVSETPQHAVSQTPAAGSDAAPAMATDVKTIYKCVDANGRVAYTEQPCAGKQEKVIVIKKDV